MTQTRKPRPDEHPGLDPEDTAGYAEEQPDDVEDARQPGPRDEDDPDEGGLGREPDAPPGAG